jgi:hypothetical protein
MRGVEKITEDRGWAHRPSVAKRSKNIEADGVAVERTDLSAIVGDVQRP